VTSLLSSPDDRVEAIQTMRKPRCPGWSTWRTPGLCISWGFKSSSGC